MKIQIKSRFNGQVIFETDAETIGGALAAAIAQRANISGANISGANISGANLSGANLYRADLYRADLSMANLSMANLYRANLSGANLSGANLSGADLSGADLSGADLYRADLSMANLSGANLSGADLKEATNWEALLPQRTIVSEGDLIGWKKLSDGTICKLKIPAKAKRVGGLIGRKCRAEFAIVMSGEGASRFDTNFKYQKGKRIKPDKFDPDPRVECSGGIHFFITREEAESY